MLDLDQIAAAIIEIAEFVSQAFCGALGQAYAIGDDGHGAMVACVVAIPDP